MTPLPVARLLADLRDAGVELAIREGRLMYRPKAIDPAIAARISAHKADLIDAINAEERAPTADGTRRVRPRQTTRRVSERHDELSIAIRPASNGHGVSRYTPRTSSVEGKHHAWMHEPHLRERDPPIMGPDRDCKPDFRTPDQQDVKAPHGRVP